MSGFHGVTPVILKKGAVLCAGGLHARDPELLDQVAAGDIGRVVIAVIGGSKAEFVKCRRRDGVIPGEHRALPVPVLDAVERIGMPATVKAASGAS